MQTTAVADSTAEFGKIRKLLWPIHNFELKKIIPMLLMFFFISFNYSILRNLKDTMLINAPGSGAEVIPYAKIGLVVPGAIIFMLFYTRLSNALSKQKLFYASLMPFLVFFILFATVLYPNTNTIHPHASAMYIDSILPQWFHGMIALYRNWSFGLFYIMAELWGSVVMSLLFWGFANDTTKVEESKRFYGLFGLGANIALEFSGRATQYYAKVDPSMLPVGTDPMQYSLNGLTMLFVISALAIMALFWFMNKHVLTDPRFFDPTKVKAKKKKPKMSLGESIHYLLNSKYLLYIAILVMAYGVSINLIEVSWKNQLRELYPVKNDYLAFMGSYNRYLAWATIFMMLFVSSNVIRSLGWRFAALVTPVALMVTGIIFFGVIIFRENMSPMFAAMGMTPVLFAVIIGTIQNVISKSAKYSLFDPTKEMTYIPLDSDVKTKGKAAIDVVAARVGKAGGAGIQLILFSFGTITALAPVISIIVVAVIGAWIVAAKNLGKKFEEYSVKV